MRDYTRTTAKRPLPFGKVQKLLHKHSNDYSKPTLLNTTLITATRSYIIKSGVCTAIMISQAQASL